MISKNSAVSPLLVGAFWPEKEKNRLLRLFFLVVSGSLLLAISAKIQVPFWPVPITMQTMVVLILGMSLGWRLGGAASHRRVGPLEQPRQVRLGSQRPRDGLVDGEPAGARVAPPRAGAAGGGVRRLRGAVRPLHAGA